MIAAGDWFVAALLLVAVVFLFYFFRILGAEYRARQKRAQKQVTIWEENTKD